MTTDFNLTSRLAENLDPHLTRLILDFLLAKDSSNKTEIAQGALNLLTKKTKLHRAVQDLQKKHFNGNTSKELTDWSAQIVKQTQTYQDKTKNLAAIIENPEVIAQFKQDKHTTLKMLQEKYGFKDEYLTLVHEYARFAYDVGSYGVAAEWLNICKVLPYDFDKQLAASWGKLASEILCNNWLTALEELLLLREMIDTYTSFTPVQQVQLRTWLIHWSLFVFFKHPKGKDAMIDFIFAPPYLATIQSSCPHILRYLTVAVIVNKRRRNMLKELVKVIQQELYAFRDPITDFVHSLYNELDFDAAQKSLADSEQILLSDFFVEAIVPDFMENARLLMFECFCRFHHRIDIRYISKKLNMSEEEGERWIVNLIRIARLDAKIDSQSHCVVMGAPQKSIYQDVIERSKDLSFRSHVMASNIEKKEKELAQRLRASTDE